MATSTEESGSVDLAAEVEQFIRDAVKQQIPRPTLPSPWARGQPRVIHEVQLWLAVLLSIARGEVSQTAVWRILVTTPLAGQDPLRVSDQAVFNRLEQAGTAVLERLFAAVLTLLTDRLAPLVSHGPLLAPFASEVVALDETTLDRVARTLPALRAIPKADHRLLPGKLAGVFDLRTQLWRQIVRIANPDQNEKVTARQLLATLQTRALIVADLGYFAFRWFDELTTAGFFWVSRVREKASFSVIHQFYVQGDTRDELVWVGKYRADQARYAARRVQFRVGNRLYQYLTNVTNPQEFPLSEIVRVYARRWDIEMAFNLAKTYLGLHTFWSAKVDVLWLQVWGVLIVSQIVQALRWEIAVRAEVDLFDVSLPLLVRYASRATAQGRNIVDWFVTEGQRLHFIRPARRIQLVLPAMPPDAIHPLPPGTRCERVPRYADKQRPSHR